MVDIRKITDDLVFGNEPEKRNIIQATARDITHGVYHTLEAGINVITFNFGKAGQNMKRAADHFGGENVKQMAQNNESDSEYSGSDNDYSGSDNDYSGSDRNYSGSDCD